MHALLAVVLVTRHHGEEYGLPRQGNLSIQTRLSREKKHSFFENKKERKKYPIFLFVEKGFYERIIGGIIALPHAK
jgi:hypothetical protein